jgi:hypothetical protein
MTILDPKQSIQKLTYNMNQKEKFAYINIPKASVIGLGKNSEYAFPAYFAKNVISSFRKNNPKVMKAVSHTLSSDIQNGRHSKIGLDKNSEYFYSNIFEYYFMKHRDIYNSFIDFYIRNSSSVVVSFHDKKNIQKHFGFQTHVINVPFNNYYDKIDSVYSQLTEFDGVDYCIFDCGVLSLGLFPKIWDNLNFSIIDLGKTLTLSKSSH